MPFCELGSTITSIAPSDPALVRSWDQLSWPREVWNVLSEMQARWDDSRATGRRNIITYIGTTDVAVTE